MFFYLIFIPTHLGFLLIILIYIYITYIPDHSGFLNDISVTLIDKTDPTDPTKREDYWIHTLKTKAPLGLNVEDGL